MEKTYLKIRKDDPQKEKKLAVHELIKEYKDITQTYDGFAQWISEPMLNHSLAGKVMGKPISRQNINEWFRLRRVPYPDKFLIILLCAENENKENYVGQIDFCRKMIDILSAN